jgi:signal transduction histidine kinase
MNQNYGGKLWIQILVRITLIAGMVLPTQAASEGRSINPINRIARLINPSLAEVENRLSWLRSRLYSLATYSPKPLQRAFGWRAGGEEGEPPPSLTMDLGNIYPLDDIFLVPAQVVAGETRTLFPMQIRIEAALQPDFSDAVLVYETQGKIYENQDGYPMRIAARDIDARYVRLVILVGHRRGPVSLSTISECVVISGGQPVSFGAKIEGRGSIDQKDYWDAQFAVDGRSPLGTWEAGRWTNSRGHVLRVAEGPVETEWLIQLDQPTPIDRVILFPVQLPELGGICALPQDLSLGLGDTVDTARQNQCWTDRGGETYSPLQASFRGRETRFISLRAQRALNGGSENYLPIGEIEVWSNGRNLAASRPVQVLRQGALIEETPSLTDGYANGLMIFPVGVWLRQLAERRDIEQEVGDLSPIRNSMAAESELHATWGASVLAGLTLLLPLGLIERRRLISKKQLDNLRRRIASDLHDDIGSNLGSISIIARTAKKDLVRLKGPRELAEDLDQVEGIARESSLAMRDIVWLLERSQDTIGDFVQRMRDTAQRLLRDFDYKLTCRSNRTAAKMTLEAKRHLFLFYKEALHNILKHSKSQKVKIDIFDHRDSLVMEIEDDGIGLPTGKVERPASVRKLTERAQVLEGQLKVTSKPDCGTQLRLEVKRTSLTIPRRSS